ncbi:NAD-dependent epimerase/dehydratase family protein [Terricaulis sp.]|uniref:NAD-dependent epimerase/dehydratase family protein n=1 Tax=Terricaulis sp. TaxID=2768686 RepID=UPI003784F836
MRIFITGASGFVGGAAAKHFVAQGHDVRAMSRSEKSDAVIGSLGATPVRCDLENVTAAHIGDAEAIVHSAAFVEQWGPKDAWFRFNVLGTRAMLEAASQAGAKRFVHISTESVLWRGQSLNGADETYPLAPNSPYPYAATKAQAEMIVKAANSETLKTIILRPRFIWGPGDTTLVPAIEAMAKSGQWMWINHGRAMTSTTHVANLIHAIELALTKGDPGEAYFVLDDGVRSMHEMISGIAASRGITLPEKSIPAWLADAIGGACEAAWGTFGLKSDPPLTRFSAMIMSRDSVLSDDKIRTEMGYRPVISVEDGLAALPRPLAPGTAIPT